jgi:hypothetical protein
MAEVWIAAVAGGVAAVGGAAIGANAAGKAAGAQAGAAQNATQTQLAEFNASAGLNTPGRNLGYGADALLAQLFGLPNPNSADTTAMYGANSSLNALGGNQTYGSGGSSTTAPGGGPSGTTAPGGSTSPGASGAPNQVFGNQTTNTASNGSPTTTNASDQFGNFFNTPGYQFALKQGQQAVQRGAAASGNLYSTNTLNQLDQNAQGYASQQYNNYVQQLFGLAGIGGTAVSGTQNAATTAGNNISANQLSAGNANASGILGAGGAFSGALNNAGGLLGNYSVLAGLNGGGDTIPPPATYNQGNTINQGGYIINTPDN